MGHGARATRIKRDKGRWIWLYTAVGYAELGQKRVFTYRNICFLAHTCGVSGLGRSPEDARTWIMLALEGKMMRAPN